MCYECEIYKVKKEIGKLKFLSGCALVLISALILDLSTNKIKQEKD